jgi:hypothetical protein
MNTMYVLVLVLVLLCQWYWVVRCRHSARVVKGRTKVAAVGRPCIAALIMHRLQMYMAACPCGSGARPSPTARLVLLRT